MTLQHYSINLPCMVYNHAVNFEITINTSQVTLSPSGPGIAGNSFSLRCSATLISPLPLPSNVPPPSFEWFYGPHGNASLLSGVTPTATIRMSGNIYTSTLLFFPTLTESHAGNYTCRLGAGRLVNSIAVSADGMQYYYSLHVPENFPKCIEKLWIFYRLNHSIA